MRVKYLVPHGKEQIQVLNASEAEAHVKEENG